MSISIKALYDYVRIYVKDKAFTGQIVKSNFHGVFEIVFKDGKMVQMNLKEETR